MAQHIEVRHKNAQKILQHIGQAIEREVAKGLSYTSMRWQRHEYAGKVWWETSRYVGEGIVYGETRANFEVHLNNTGRIAEHIYLVA